MDQRSKREGSVPVRKKDLKRIDDGPKSDRLLALKRTLAEGVGPSTGMDVENPALQDRDQDPAGAHQVALSPAPSREASPFCSAPSSPSAASAHASAQPQQPEAQEASISALESSARQVMSPRNAGVVSRN